MYEHLKTRNWDSEETFIDKYVFIVMFYNALISKILSSASRLSRQVRVVLWNQLNKSKLGTRRRSQLVVQTQPSMKKRAAYRSSLTTWYHGLVFVKYESAFEIIFRCSFVSSRYFVMIWYQHYFLWIYLLFFLGLVVITGRFETQVEGLSPYDRGELFPTKYPHLGEMYFVLVP